MSPADLPRLVRFLSKHFLIKRVTARTQAGLMHQAFCLIVEAGDVDFEVPKVQETNGTRKATSLTHDVIGELRRIIDFNLFRVLCCQSTDINCPVSSKNFRYRCRPTGCAWRYTTQRRRNSTIETDLVLRHHLVRPLTAKSSTNVGLGHF